MSSSPSSCARFPQTRWSVFQRAQDDDRDVSRTALDEFAELYWEPIYGFIRRSGFLPHDAQDLTQEFMLQVVSKEHLRAADPAKGRVRCYLATLLRYFLADRRRLQRAAKRGGGKVFTSIQAYPNDAAERRYGEHLTDDASPEKIFERTLALSVLESALDELQSFHAPRGEGGPLRTSQAVSTTRR